MEVGFVKAQSDNLPKIDYLMVAEFLKRNLDYCSTEIRGDKTKRSARETYGDDAIGYVQVKREVDICTVKAKITPEHKVRNNGYNCVLKCHEQDQKILNVQCEDCTAQKGGCKHSIAFLMWLHRRSEEASPTEIKCYWSKPKLAKVGTAIKFIKAKDIGTKVENLQVGSNSNQRIFLKGLVDIMQNSTNGDIQLNQYFKENKDKLLSIHFLYKKFMKEPQNDIKMFLDFCTSNMTDLQCKNVEQNTINQSKCSLWYEMRYCRITASKAYEAAHCKTYNGSLVEQIFGAKVKDTTAMKRGKILEDNILREVCKEMKINFKRCGFFLRSEWPVVGASPDGISDDYDDYVLEIKCPTSENTIKSYVKDGVPKNKCNAQIQVQMFFTGKKKGVLCLASPKFEQDKSITLYEVCYNQIYCLNLLKDCTAFWENAIFEKLKQTFA